jgi:hypothetical protein
MNWAIVPSHNNSFHNISSPADLLSEHTCSKRGVRRQLDLKKTSFFRDSVEVHLKFGGKSLLAFYEVYLKGIRHQIKQPNSRETQLDVKTE